MTRARPQLSSAPPVLVAGKHENLSSEAVRILAQLPVQHPTPLLVTDLREKVLYANPAFDRVSGKRQAEVLGRSVRDFFVPLEGVEAWTRTFADVTAGHLHIETIALVQNGASGDRFDLEFAPIRDTDGQVKFISMRLLAHHEEMEAVSQVRQAQKMQAIGTLAAGIAHDFNNILYSILGNADLALADVKNDSPVKESLEEILLASKRAAELVSHILAFSKPSEHERQPMDLGPLVKGVSKFLRSSFPSTIEVSYSVSECGQVIADPAQLHQMLVNLGTNALHAMQGMAGTLDIVVQQVLLDAIDCVGRPPLRPGPYVEITVRDTGCGMDAMTLDRAFEPYFSTKERQTGVGLGLAVVYGIVKSHGGFVEIASEVGKGTTVTVLLPVAESLAKAASEEKRPCTQRLRVLFVDDEPAIARMGRRVLERLGHCVQAFESANAALKAFAADPSAFDVLVTDQTMPDMTGTELSRRCLELRPDLPIVLSSGFSEGLDEKTVREHGIREFVMKPIVSRDLEKAIGRAIDPGDQGA